MNKCNWLYKSTVGMVLLLAFVTSLNQLIRPVKLSSYVEILPNGKVLIDKQLLENIQHPPIVEFALWAVGNGALAQWLLPLEIDSIANAARSSASATVQDEFWINYEDGEAPPTGPAHLASSYAHTYWYRHLQVLLLAAETEGKPYLSAFGRFMIRNACVEALKVQLAVVKLWKENREALQKEKISQPIVIAGPPRSMTTHAQSILANHPDVFYLRFSEGIDPLLPENLAKEKVFTGEDPRHRLLNVGSWVVSYLRPFFYYMFRFDKENMGNTAQEDIFIQAMVFGSPQYETNTYIPSYSMLWHSESNIATYRFLKQTQQVMQWQKNRMFGLKKHGRWLMKTPEHVAYIKDLMQVYPDAMWILTHRDPVPVVKSFIPMILYIQGMWNSRIDAKLFADYQLISLQKRFERFVDQVDLIPEKQIIHVPFHDFVKNNEQWIKRICEFTGLRWEGANGEMLDYIANSPREGANRFEYRIETLGKGYDSDTLKERFKAYSEHFKEYI